MYFKIKILSAVTFMLFRISMVENLYATIFKVSLTEELTGEAELAPKILYIK